MQLALDGYTEREVLEFLLVGLEARRAEILGKIEELQAAVTSVTPPPIRMHERRMSVDGRARIAQAQKRRWRKAKRVAAAKERTKVEARAARKKPAKVKATKTPKARAKPAAKPVAPPEAVAGPPGVE